MGRGPIQIQKDECALSFAICVFLLPEAGGGVLSLIAAVGDVTEVKTLWQLRKSFPGTPLLLDLHCDISAFFSQVSKLGGEEIESSHGSLLSS